MLNKYPYIKQQANKDCGIVSLQMIIKYYKGYISLEKLRYITKTNKEGTNAYNLINGAKEIGFEAYGVKCNLDDINSDNLPLPCIAHVIIDNLYHHYVVIYKINYNKKYLIIADPATKVSKISFKKFSEIFDNILIILYPITQIPNERNNITVQSYINKILKRNITMIYKIIFLSVFITIISIFTSLYFKFITDNLINSKQIIVFIFIIYLFMNLIKIITTFIKNKLLIIYDKLVSIDLSNEIYRRIITLPYHYYNNRTTGEIISYFDNATNIKNTIIKLLITIFTDIPLSLLSLIVIFIINKDFMFIGLFILFLNIILSFIYKNMIINILPKIQKKRALTTSFMVETISSFETVKGINLKDKVINKFRYKNNEYLLNMTKLDNLQNKYITIKDFLRTISELVIILLGSFYVMDNKISIGSLIAINTLFTYFLIPFESLPETLISYNDTKISLQKILDLFYYKKNDSKLKLIPTGDIKINNLSFSYNNIDNNLNDVSLEIKKNEKVLLIGPSGSGKTTLLKLIMKYYNIKRNMITINNIDLNDYNEETFHENMSYISQNESLFNDTLFNNINIYNSPNEEFIKYSNLCFINEILKDNNYNVLIEENGINFSGGEKQRIILARTLLKNDKYILIDEGLSQMDINLERKILKNIFNISKDKTIIITSHRLENMDLFDKVIKMCNGRIVEVINKNV